MEGERLYRQLGLPLDVAQWPATKKSELLDRISGLVDFQFVRQLTKPYFADIGRPSIDAVVMVKMMLIGYLFGVPSDRQLADDCADRLSFRKFLGFGMNEALPHHSSFTRWRKRLGPDFFDEMLHEIVRQCVEGGMKVSGVRCVDATAVKAQADKDGPVVRVPKGKPVDEFLDDYFDGDAQPAPPDDKSATPINTHDPDARAQSKPGQLYGFYYQPSLSSCPSTGLITDTWVSGFESALTAVDHVDRDPFDVDEICADSLYDNGQMLAQLIERGVVPYVPRKSHDKPGQLSKDRFAYAADRDIYICPAGKELKHSRYDEDKREHFYVAKKSDCETCPLKSQCTKASRRTVTRKDDEWAREQTVRAGPRYDALMVARSTAEHLNMLAKRDHGMDRARSLGLDAMRIQTSLTAVAINLKKLVGWHLSRHFASILWALTAASATHRRQARWTGPYRRARRV
jgi:transposase